MDRLEAAKYIKDHCLGSEVYRDGTTWNDAMVTAVEVLEGKDTNVPANSALDHIHNVVRDDAYRRGYEQGNADANHPEIPDSWIPVTPDTMPEKNRVVVVCGEKGTWDYGTYRGHLNSINNWNWKKNTVKTVYWWMYKEDALPMPWEGEQNGQTD